MQIFFYKSEKGLGLDCNLIYSENWKLKKTIFKRQQNNISIASLKKHLLYSFSFENVPLLFFNEKNNNLHLLTVGGQTSLSGLFS